MPYNFNTKEKYKFDFSQCINGVINSTFFMGQKKYIERWYKIFTYLDNKYTNFFPTEQYFQYEYKINGSPYYIHFNINGVLNLAHEKQYKIEYINAKYFGTNDACILYQNEKYNKHHLTSTEPILICPLPTNNSNYIVIDGNHRLSAQHKLNKPIPSLIVAPTNRSCFLQEIDRAIYLCANELYNFSILMNKGERIENLLKNSNVYTTYRHII